MKPEKKIEIESASPEELFTIIGEAEATRARAWAQLMAPNAAAVQRPDEALNAREAGERIGVGKDWIYAHAHEIPGSWRNGKILRFSAAAIEAWKVKEGKVREGKGRKENG
jgi:predicted DNA-binding transcriptional regulator AlpA